ncbi:CDP-alcohol phosphatidyltransferase family protein [Patescibacteria group bacterium]
MITKIDKNDIIGNKKEGSTLVKPLEQIIIKTLLPVIPKFIHTSHLTLASLVLSFLIIIVSFLARNNYNWLWLTSIIMLSQAVTDMLDGEVGRKRNTGLVYWGFYMDHFLDYVFTSAIILGYIIIFPQYVFVFLIAFFTMAGFFFHESQRCIIFGKYNVTGYYGFGATELRIILVLINTYIIFFGSVKVIYLLVAFVITISISLIVRVYKTQKELWKIDLKNKKNEK